MIMKLIKKMIYKEKYNSITFIKWMRQKGASVGERTVIFSPMHTTIDMTRPWLIDIGNDVQITEGVTILTHGYDWSVLKGLYGEVIGSSGRVHIGNNVFIGMKTTILKGVHIGNNVIIGANSLVNKNIPDNCVVAGNPAKVIMTIEEYYEKRKAAQYDEAKELVIEYKKVYEKDPGNNELSEFFWLFTNQADDLPYSWDSKMRLVGNYNESKNKILKNHKMFESLNDFIDKISESK